MITNLEIFDCGIWKMHPELEKILLQMEYQMFQDLNEYIRITLFEVMRYIN
jgi:hypothetical protein